MLEAATSSLDCCRRRKRRNLRQKKDATVITIEIPNKYRKDDLIEIEFDFIQGVHPKKMDERLLLNNNVKSRSKLPMREPVLELLSVST